jgi:hypothetical protein
MFPNITDFLAGLSLFCACFVTGLFCAVNIMMKERK